MTTISFARRLAELAATGPEVVALTVDTPGRDGTPGRTETHTRAELQSRATQTAHAFAYLGVGHGDLVSIGLPNGAGFIEAVLACWQLGAVPAPLNHLLAPAERAAIVAVARPALVLGWEEPPADTPWLPQGWQAGGPDTPLPDAVSPAWKAPASGGSTGTPKVIRATQPSALQQDAGPLVRGMRTDGAIVVPGPLSHNGPFVYAMQALLHGNQVGLLTRFDAARTLALVELLRADLLILVPTMMSRIWRLPGRESYDVSSLQTVWHVAAPCPAWLKQAWIDWLGAERIYETYAGTESSVATVIRGDEWLAHPGSVGRPVMGSIAAFDPAGGRLEPGEVGEIYLRQPRGQDPTYTYLGAQARTLEGGWESLGDLGWVDEDGYVFLCDRRTDLILVGGANVYPAEVELALESHPLVLSAAVVGEAHADLGEVVHAYVQTTATQDELLEHLRGQLSPYKVPRRFTFVDHALRDDAGKVRRFELRASG
jgi:bile acid-coenzyme A ligase